MMPVEAKLQNDGHTEPRLDIDSPTWKYIEQWASEGLERRRVENDNQNLTEQKTANKRGQIRILKDLLDLPNDGTGQQDAPGILFRHSQELPVD